MLKQYFFVLVFALSALLTLSACNDSEVTTQAPPSTIALVATATAEPTATPAPTITPEPTLILVETATPMPTVDVQSQFDELTVELITDLVTATGEYSNVMYGAQEWICSTPGRREKIMVESLLYLNYGGQLSSFDALIKDDCTVTAIKPVFEDRRIAIWQWSSGDTYYFVNGKIDYYTSTPMQGEDLRNEMELVFGTPMTKAQVCFFPGTEGNFYFDTMLASSPGFMEDVDHMCISEGAAWLAWVFSPTYQ